MPLRMKLFLIVLFLSSPVMAMEPLTPEESGALQAGTLKPIMYIVPSAQGDVIWLKWKVDWYGIMTLYGCTATYLNEFMAAVPKGQDMSLSSFVNLKTPNGYKKTWTSQQVCPAPDWCCQ